MSIDSKKKSIEISVNYRETSKNLIAEQNPRASMEQKYFQPDLFNASNRNETTS